MNVNFGAYTLSDANKVEYQQALKSSDQSLAKAQAAVNSRKQDPVAAINYLAAGLASTNNALWNAAEPLQLNENNGRTVDLNG